MTLLMTLLISVLAAGVILATQSEIWTTANYTAGTQSRYVAEAGAQQAANWIDNYWNNNLPDFTQISPATWTLSTFPVTFNGSKVVLTTSGFRGQSDTYTGVTGGATSGSDVDQNFKNSMDKTSAMNNGVFKNLYASGSGTGNKFEVSLQLLQAYKKDLTASANTIVKWKIVSQGTVGLGSRAAMTQVVQIVTQTISNTGGGGGSPRFAGAVYATGTGCGAVTMNGNSQSGSYNSVGNIGNNRPTTTGTGGDVWSAGNITLSGSANVDGNAYTPGTISAYTNGAWADPLQHTAYACTGTPIRGVTADKSGSNVVGSKGGIANKVNYFDPTLHPMPTPTLPSVPTNTANCLTKGCEGSWVSSLNLAPNPTGNYGSVSFSASNSPGINLSAGTYNFNCLSISSGVIVNIPSNGTVIINIYGVNPNDRGNVCGSNPNWYPVNINGGTLSNSGGNPANLQIVYAGTDTVKLGNGANFFGTIYAPNAFVDYSGDFKTYGSIVAKTINISGGAYVYYDTNLGVSGPTNPGDGSPSAGSVHLSEYSWSAY